MSPALPAFLAALGVMLVCGLVFSPVLTAGFLSRDDGRYVQQAAQARGLGWPDVSSIFRIFSVPTDTGGYYQPLMLLSLALDARITSDPAAPAFQFHLTNLGLHLANAALLFVLLRSLTGGLAWPIMLTLLYGLHPAQVESVAWISQRGTLLATCFSLMALCEYRRHLASPSVWRLAYVTLCYAAAVLSMPTFLALPVILLMLDLWPAARSGWRPLVEKVPMFLLLGGTVWVHAAIHRRLPPKPGGMAESATLLGWNLAGFMKRLFWPFDLSPFYPITSDRFSGVQIAGLVAVPVVILVLGAWSFRRCRPLFVALCGMLALLLPPMLNVAYSEQLLGDAYLYPVMIPLLAVMAAVVAARGNLLSLATGRVLAVSLVALSCIFAARSYGATFIWQSSQSLYHEVLARHPSWPGGYTGLVEAYLQENEYDSALVYARKAAQIAPDDPTTQFYLGTTLLLHHGGKSAEAIAPLRRALRSNPNWIACLQNLGVALARTGRIEQAIGYLEKARDLEPESAGIRIGLGHAYLKVHRPASARRELQEALRHRNDPIIHFGLAVAWAANDAMVPAKRHLAAALARDPRMAGRIAAAPELRELGEAMEREGTMPDFPLGAYDADMFGIELPATRDARGS